MLQGKTVVLGVTGGIAAYKMPNVARMLKKMNCNVHVIMTQNACNFITPTTFETLTGTKCLIDTFDRNFEFSVEHVALAKAADLFLIAPATANVIGKIAWGIADDMLTTTVTACTCKVIIAPAMNHNMYLNPIIQDNIERLKKFDYEIIPPVVGMLANGDIGSGKLPEEEAIVHYCVKELAFKKDLSGQKVLVTAGPTVEAIDPVRYITNHSSGKMGYALAKMAMLRGAEVTLISGPVALKPLPFVHTIHIKSAKEMYQAVIKHCDKQDIIVKAAAVSDFRPEQTASEKIKKKGKESSLILTQTEDILKTLGERKKSGKLNAFLCGFAMETQDMMQNAHEKLDKKNLDMIVANNLKEEGAGFKTDTNILTLITDTGSKQLPLLSKEEAANYIYDQILEIR